MPNGKWARKLIQIDTDCGLVKIPARTLGPLAVHFGIGSQSEKISISHVGTGRRIASTSSEEAAQQIAEAPAELDWEMLQSDSLPPGCRSRCHPYSNATNPRSTTHPRAEQLVRSSNAEFIIEEAQDRLPQTPEAKQYGPTQHRPLKLSQNSAQAELPSLYMRHCRP